jgi:hypothetical protein
MPTAFPRPFRAFRRAVSDVPAAPARFVEPLPVSKQFCSTDDRAELRRVRAERRLALTKLRRSSRPGWRDAP